MTHNEVSGPPESAPEIAWRRVTARVMPETAERLHEVAELTGRSPQDIAGLAIDHALGACGGGLSEYLLTGVLDAIVLAGGVVADCDEPTPDGVRAALIRNVPLLRGGCHVAYQRLWPAALDAGGQRDLPK